MRASVLTTLVWVTVFWTDLGPEGTRPVVFVPQGVFCRAAALLQASTQPPADVWNLLPHVWVIADILSIKTKLWGCK